MGVARCNFYIGRAPFFFSRHQNFSNSCLRQLRLAQRLRGCESGRLRCEGQRAQTGSAVLLVGKQSWLGRVSYCAWPSCCVVALCCVLRFGSCAGPISQFAPHRNEIREGFFPKAMVHLNLLRLPDGVSLAGHRIRLAALRWPLGMFPGDPPPTGRHLRSSYIKHESPHANGMGVSLLDWHLQRPLSSWNNAI